MITSRVLAVALVLMGCAWYQSHAQFNGERSPTILPPVVGTTFWNTITGTGKINTITDTERMADSLVLLVRAVKVLTMVVGIFLGVIWCTLIFYGTKSIRNNLRQSSVGRWP